MSKIQCYLEADSPHTFKLPNVRTTLISHSLQIRPTRSNLLGKYVGLSTASSKLFTKHQLHSRYIIGRPPLSSYLNDLSQKIKPGSSSQINLQLSTQIIKLKILPQQCLQIEFPFFLFFCYFICSAASAIGFVLSKFF